MICIATSPLHRLRRAGIAAVLASGFGSPAVASDLKVAVTSKPVHALVASVMGATGSPTLLVAGNASPHSYTMKPSDVSAVAGARLFIRVAEGLEPFTAKLLRALPRSVEVITLLDTPGLDLLARREGGAFEAAGGHGHGHGHDHVKPKAGDERDPHVWLDPVNARLLVDHIAVRLGAAQPAQAATFAANAAAAKDRIVALQAELERELKPVAGKPFVVLHDAYRYLERRYGLTAVGSIAVTPEAAPSGRRLAAIRKKIADSGAKCVFAEPGMQPKVVAAVVEGTAAKAALLDPEATALPPGPDLYGNLMRGVAAAMAQCLSAK